MFRVLGLEVLGFWVHGFMGLRVFEFRVYGSGGGVSEFRM